MKIPKESFAFPPDSPIDSDLILSFAHFSNPNPPEDWQSHVPPPTHVTQCRIFTLEGDLETVLAEGQAYCSSRDAFCRKTGRKHALSRALLTSDFPKPVRRQIWRTYFESTGAKYSMPK